MTTIASTDSFNFRRALAFSRCFQPSIRRQMILYPVISLVFVVSSTILGNYKLGLPLIVLMSTISSFMAYLAPLVFTIGSDLTIETLLPVKDSERAAFITFYSLIVCPLLVCIPDFAVKQIMLQFFPAVVEDNFMYEMIQENPLTNMPLSVASALVPVATCLFAISVYRHRRILMPVVWTVVSLIAISILSGVVAVSRIFQIGMSDGIEGLENRIGSDPDTARDFLMGELQPAFIVIAALCVAYVIFISIMAYRNIKNRQI